MMTTATSPAASSDASAREPRFVVATWSDQRRVRQVIMEELVAASRPRFALGGWLTRHPKAVSYEALRERYDEMKRRGEIVESEAFIRARARSGFTEQAAPEEGTVLGRPTPVASACASRRNQQV